MIVILAKAPRPGRCKTRLIPRLGARGAAQLQAALLERTVHTARESGVPVTVFCTPDHRHPAFTRLRRCGVATRQQQGNDLGARMLHAARWGLRHHPRVLILGTDSPALSAAVLTTALEAQTTTLIPAIDGGYVGLALSAASANVFRRVHWGSARVLRQTRRNLARMDAPWSELTAHADLDTTRDWHAQRRAGVLSALISCRRS